MTFLILHAANVALAASALWIRFRNPTLWDDQAMVYVSLVGVALASFTAILLGISMLFSTEDRWKPRSVHLALTLAFVAIQGWLLYVNGRDLGLMQVLKSRLGG